MIANEIMIDHEVLNQIAQGVFQTMLEIELFPCEVEMAGDCLQATIEIDGAWGGTVSLAFSADLARNAASRMLKLAADDVTPTDEQEVAAELANMVGGNLKSLLPSPSQLSLPLVSASSAEGLSPSEVVTLAGSEGRLRVMVSHP